MPKKRLFNIKPLSNDVIDKAASQQTFYQVSLSKNKETEQEIVDLVIFEQIGHDPWTGEGVGAKDVAAFLSENKGKEVNVRINSPGGLAFDGITIHNSLIQHSGNVNVTVEGIAASAAAIIMLAGDNVRMFDNASTMFHRAMGWAFGNRDEMDAMIEILDSLDEQIALTLSQRSTLDKEEAMSLLVGKHDGTTLTAEEALEVGIIDSVITRPKKQKKQEAEDRSKSSISNMMKRECSMRLRSLELDNDSIRFDS